MRLDFWGWIGLVALLLPRNVGRDKPTTSTLRSDGIVGLPDTEMEMCNSILLIPLHDPFG